MLRWIIEPGHLTALVVGVVLWLTGAVAVATNKRRGDYSGSDLYARWNVPGGLIWCLGASFLVAFVTPFLWRIYVILVALLLFYVIVACGKALFSAPVSPERTAKEDRIVNDVVKKYLVGKKDGLSIDEIEEQIASKNEIELLEPYSQHLEREVTLFSFPSNPAKEEVKELLVLQRITFDICCSHGLYPTPTGKRLNPADQQNLKLIGDKVVARLLYWRSRGA